MKKGSHTPTIRSSNQDRKPRSRRPRRGGNVSRASRIHHIEQALSSTVKKAYRDMFGAGSDPIKPFILDLHMIIDPKQSWQFITQPDLEEQIMTAVQEMAAQAEAYRKGRVYCYRCESLVCEHSLPQGPTTVFGGYSSTGVPIWSELTQVLLELKHPRIDLLYHDTQTEIIAAYMEPARLKSQQLNIFGKQSKTYNILGQVVFGFLKIQPPGEKNQKPEPVAFTLQAVESRLQNGAPQLELNVLSRLSDNSQSLDALTNPHQLRIYNVIISARRLLASLSPSPKKKPQGNAGSLSPDIPSQITQTLTKLARKLEKVSRQKSRRTAHAQEPRITYRPTSKAWDDINEATDELILKDRHQHTFVILGPRNRVHIFSAEGRHVTSFLLKAEAVQSRIRRKRWVIPSEDERIKFKATISGITRPPAEEST